MADRASIIILPTVPIEHYADGRLVKTTPGLPRPSAVTRGASAVIIDLRIIRERRAWAKAVARMRSTGGDNE